MASASAVVTPSPSPRISVIVPTLNEQAHLSATLRGVTLAPGDELIVVDGGSTDQTVAIAQQFTLQVLHSHQSLDLGKLGSPRQL